MDTTHRTVGSCTTFPPKQRGHRRRKYSLGLSMPGPAEGMSSWAGGDDGGGDDSRGGDDGGSGEEGGDEDVGWCGDIGDTAGNDIAGWLAASISRRIELREC